MLQLIIWARIYLVYCHRMYQSCLLGIREVFTTLSNVYDFVENSHRLWKIVNGEKPWALFAKNFITDVWQDRKYPLEHFFFLERTRGNTKACINIPINIVFPSLLYISQSQVNRKQAKGENTSAFIKGVWGNAFFFFRSFFGCLLNNITVALD